MNANYCLRIIVLIICSYSASGQVSLLKDINDQPKVPEMSAHRVGYNGFAYYNGSNGMIGSELWRTDGTLRGTGPVKDIYPGSGSAHPANLTVAEGILYFSADDGVHGTELWRSDGSEAGTYMVADIYEGPGGSAPAELTYAHGVLYFTAFFPGSGVELWSSDGTAQGTVMVADLNTVDGAGSSPDHIIEYDSAAYFVADDGSPGVELWRTDGTASGTTLVASLNDSVADARVSFMVVVNSSIFLGVFDGTFYKAWTSDGTTEGTFPLNDVNVLAGATQNQIIGDYLYFAGSEGSSGEYELWRTNGTPSHTELVATINPHEGIGSRPNNILAIDSILYFAAQATTSSQKFALYKSTGVPGDYTLIDDRFVVGRGPGEMTNFNGKLCFRAGDPTYGWEFFVYNGQSLTVYNLSWGGFDFYPHHFIAISQGLVFSPGVNDRDLDGLWKYNLTVTRIADAEPRSSNPTAFSGTANGLTFFVANDGISGQELWATDGTTQRTFMVKNIHPTGDSAPAELTTMGNTLFFTANDGVHGLEVWKSDGTMEGTVIVSDIIPGAGGSSPSELTAVGNVLFFEASAGGGLNQLWKSVDGAPPTLVKTLPGTPYSMTALAPYVYFRSSTGMGEPILDWSPEPLCALWRSDGTEEGTIIIRNLTGCSDRVASRELVTMGSNLYFQDGPVGIGNELWKYDGKEVSLVRDINPGGGSYPGNFVVIGDTLFFGANDGAHGYELWMTDGSVLNTMLVKDINPGPNTGLDRNRYRGTFGGEPYPPYAELSAMAGKLYFSGNDGLNGWELWKSDGTVLGTTMMNDIVPGSGSSGPFRFRVADSSLFFFSGSEHKIFVTTGEGCGTREVEIPLGSQPEWLASSGNKIYGSLFFGNLGREPMVIDPLSLDPAPADCAPSDPIPVVLTADQTSATDQPASGSLAKEYSEPYPNPFTENITIPVTIKNENTFVQIAIYDSMGERIADVISETLPSGYHEVNWNGVDRNGNKVTQGMYTYKIKSNGDTGIAQGRLVAK